jgi:hypothetical protein
MRDVVRQLTTLCMHGPYACSRLACDVRLRLNGVNRDRGSWATKQPVFAELAASHNSLPEISWLLPGAALFPFSIHALDVIFC